MSSHRFRPIPSSSGMLFKNMVRFKLSNIVDVVNLLMYNLPSSITNNQVVYIYDTFILLSACGLCCSVFSKLGELEKAEQAFEVLYTSEEGADEIAYSQIIHCYGSAG